MLKRALPLFITLLKRDAFLSRSVAFRTLWVNGTRVTEPPTPRFNAAFKNHPYEYALKAKLLRDGQRSVPLTLKKSPEKDTDTR
ncbi:hypothetical protein RR46_01170 [Papilio xuthus]|uniref:Uncharacterized protein n=1 Tax=Papilio xuthus TaxID=66420 RepID=A0A0N1I571_PAPXU|nr:hypothetical protein RR46_01170 [Papilio xuthus]